MVDGVCGVRASVGGDIGRGGDCRGDQCCGRRGEGDGATVDGYGYGEDDLEPTYVLLVREHFYPVTIRTFSDKL